MGVTSMEHEGGSVQWSSTAAKNQSSNTGVVPEPTQLSLKLSRACETPLAANRPPAWAEASAQPMHTYLWHVQRLHDGREGVEVPHGIFELHRHLDDPVESGRSVLQRTRAAQDVHCHTNGHCVVSERQGYGVRLQHGQG